jgi:hypothetical protein
MRLGQIRNKAAPSEIILEVCIRRTGNQLIRRLVYIAPFILSKITINVPLNYNEETYKLRSALFTNQASICMYIYFWTTIKYSVGLHDIPCVQLFSSCVCTV